MISFSGKVIAITGASEGIGAELARQVAGKSGLKEDRAMPVDECVRQIIQATRARKREHVMTLQGRIGLWLKLAFPKVVDRMILRTLKKD